MIWLVGFNVSGKVKPCGGVVRKDGRSGAFVCGCSGEGGAIYLLKWRGVLITVGVVFVVRGCGTIEYSRLSIVRKIDFSSRSRESWGFCEWDSAAKIMRQKTIKLFFARAKHQPAVGRDDVLHSPTAERASRDFQKTHMKMTLNSV